VVAHSVRSELERCFHSIKRHAEVPVEVILVDNASTDGTGAWVRAAHPDVRLIELPENLGVAARDYGLRQAQSPYTMFLDSDAALTPGALPTMVRALDRQSEWGLVGPRLIYEDGALQRSCRRFPPMALPVLRRPPLDRVFEKRGTVRRHLMADFDHDTTRAVLYLLGACQLFRTSLARVAGSFDDRVFLGWDDADWCFRIRDAGGEIVFLPEATVIHSYRRQTQLHPLSRASLRQLEAFFYFPRLYWPRRKELIELSEELDRRASPGSR
jgi:GT2 family glycosyltransferase